MEYVVCCLRKYASVTLINVLFLFPLSLPVYAGPADALNLWYPVVDILSDNEESDKPVTEPVDVADYSDTGLEIRNASNQSSASLQNSDQEFFKRNSLSIHVGSTTMLDMEQSLDKVVGTECALWIFGCVYDRDIIEPLPLTFKSTPGTVLGIKYERYMRGNWSYGFEYFRSVHQYTAPSLTPKDGELEITRVFFALKKYFETGSAFQPYFGVSGGLLDAKMSGAITSSYDDGGTGWNGVVGVKYQFDSVNLRVSYRYSESSIHIGDTFINDGQRRKTYGDLSTRSDGYFVGVEVRF